MAAPPWTARTKWSLHWYSQGGCDHQWPIGHSPESPGKAVMSRAGMALFPWQPPPDVPETNRPSIGIRAGGVITDGPLVTPQSPQGTLWCLESPKTGPGISPPDGPIPTGPTALEASPQALAACQKWSCQLQRGRRQSALKSKSFEKFRKSSKWAGLICVLGIYRGDYLQRAHKRASMETGGTWVSEAALRYGRSVRPCGFVRGRLWVGEGEMTYSPKRRFWAYLSDPRCLPRSETSESTVVTVLARSKTRTKVCWGIRLVGKFLDRQVSSPRPEGKILDRQVFSLWSEWKILDRQVSSPRPERKILDRQVFSLWSEWKILDRQVFSLWSEWKILDRQVFSLLSEWKILDRQVFSLWSEWKILDRQVSSAWPEPKVLDRPIGRTPERFDRGIPSHTRPVLTRWIGSRTSSNPTVEPSGSETTWPTVTDSATRVQKRPPRTRRLECKSDRLERIWAIRDACRGRKRRNRPSLQCWHGPRRERKFVEGFGWWESSSIGRSLHHGLRERSSIGRSFHSGPSERSSIGRSFHSCPSERSSIGRSFHSCPSKRSSIGRSFHSGPSERSSIGRSLQRGPSQRSSIGRSAAHPSVFTGAFPRTPDQFWLGESGRGRRPIRPGNRAAWRRRGRPSPIRRLECKSDRLGLGDSSAKATALSVFERSAMLAAVGNVGIDRRYSAGTVQDENESLLRDSAGGKVPRSAGLFTTAWGKDPRSAGLFTLVRVKDPRSAGLFTLVRVKDPRSAGLFTLARVKDPRSAGLFTLARVKDPRYAGLLSVARAKGPRWADRPHTRAFWPGYSLAHPTSFDSVNRVADVVQSDRGTERLGDDVADRHRFGDSSAKATASDSATRVQKRPPWAYLSDPRCLPRSETSESTVITVLARSKTRTKVCWGIRLVGKFLDRQVSSPRPEGKILDRQVFSLWSEWKILDRQVFSLLSEWKILDRQVFSLLSEWKILDRQVFSLWSEWKILDRQVFSLWSEWKILDRQVFSLWSEWKILDRQVSSAWPEPKLLHRPIGRTPERFDRGIPSHTRPVLTRWIGSRTSSNPTGEPSGLETTWPTVTHSATRVQKRPPRTRRLECKSDRLERIWAIRDACRGRKRRNRPSLQCWHGPRRERKFVEGFGWWESSSIGRSLHHGLRERSSIGRSFHSGPSERSSIGRSFHSCPSERSWIGRSFHSCPSERSWIGRSLQRGPSQRSSIGRSAAHPSVLTGAFPRTPDQFWLGESGRGRRPIRPGNRAAWRRRGRPSPIRRLECKSDRLGLGDSSAKATALSVFERSAMLAAVGNVGIDRRYSAGTVQDENESLLRDSAGGKVPRSAGLFTTAWGKDPRSAGLLTLVRVKDPRSAGLFTLVRVKDPRSAGLFTLVRVKDPRSAGLFTLVRVKDPRSAGLFSVARAKGPRSADRPHTRAFWPGHSLAHPTSFDSVNRVADVVQSDRGTERLGDDVADRHRFGDSSAKATASDLATRVQKRPPWAYLSDPRCLPRSETSESTVVTVLARSKTRTKVCWGIRLVGKFLDRQVSSPRPEGKILDRQVFSLWSEWKILDRQVFSLLSEWKILDRQVFSLLSEWKILDRQVFSLWSEWKILDRQVSSAWPEPKVLHRPIGRTPERFDRGIPSHTRPVLTRWIGSRTSSNPTGEPSGLETTRQTVTDSATRVQKRPPRTRRLECKSDRLERIWAIRDACRGRKRRNRPSLQCWHGPRRERKFVEGFGWWESSSIGRSLHHGLRERSSIGRSFHSGPSERSSIGRSFHSCPSERSSIGRSFHSCPSERSSIGRSFHSGPSERSSIGRSLQRGPSQRSSIGRSAAHPSVLTGAFPRTPDQFWLGESGRGRRPIQPGNRAAWRRRGRPSPIRRLECKSDRLGLGDSSAKATALSVFERSAMLAAVGNVGIDRRYSAGTVQDENESLLRDSAGGKVPRSAGLFTTAWGKDPRSAGLFTLVRVKDPRSAGLFTLVRVKDPRSAGLFTLVRVKDPRSAGLFSVARAKGPPSADRPHTRAFWPGHSLAHPTSFDSVNRVADVVQSDRGTERLGDDVADRHRFGDSSAKATASDSATRVQKRPPWAHLSDPRCLPRSETSESTVVTVLARSKTRTKVCWGIRLVGKFLDRQVSSPRPEGKILDRQVFSLWSKWKILDRQVFSLLSEWKILDRQVFSLLSEWKILDRQVFSLWSEWKILDRQVFSLWSEWKILDRQVSSAWPEPKVLHRPIGRTPERFDRGIPSHTQPVLTRWIGSRTSSNPTGEPSGLETTWPTVTDSATRVQKRPPRTRRLECKSDRLERIWAIRDACRGRKRRNRPSLQCWHGPRRERKFVEGFGWWESSSIGRSLHHGPGKDPRSAGLFTLVRVNSRGFKVVRWGHRIVSKANDARRCGWRARPAEVYSFGRGNRIGWRKFVGVTRPTVGSPLGGAAGGKSAVCAHL